MELTRDVLEAKLQAHQEETMRHRDLMNAHIGAAQTLEELIGVLDAPCPDDGKADGKSKKKER